MRIRSVLIHHLLKSDPTCSYDHLTLIEAAQEYSRRAGLKPIEVSIWLLANDVIRHPDRYAGI